MFQRQLQSLINYSNINLYDYVNNKTKLTQEEKDFKLCIIFKQLMNEIRAISVNCIELDRFNTPMGFLFQHIKPQILTILANCSSPHEKYIIDSGINRLKNTVQYTLEYNILIFNKLLTLNSKDTILWLLFQVPYYNSYGTGNVYDNISSNINNNKGIENSENIVTSSNIVDLDRYRDVYEQMLDYAIDHWPAQKYFTEEEFIFASNETCMPYASAYHNRNNVSLLSKYSAFLRKVCPWINYYSPILAAKMFKTHRQSTHRQSTHIQHNNMQIGNQIPMQTGYQNALEPIPTGDENDTFSHFHDFPTISSEKSGVQNELTGRAMKIKLAFISDSMAQDTSVLRDRVSIIGKLDRTRYDVYFASFVQFDKIKGNVARIFMNRIKDKYIYLGTTISSARTKLEDLNLDIIIFPDLGMKLLPTLLAHSRIAPIQINTWGHSETSGIDTIDYYISSCWFNNSQNIEKHYSEQLILMKSLSTFYISPHRLFILNDPLYSSGTKILQTRVQLGFNNSQHLYCCLQTFYKFNIDFEHCLAKILELDPNGIILLSNSFPFCKSHLQRMMTTFGEEKIKRVKWYGSLEKDQFLNIVSICDVCLDPFPFGGCNTSFDAFDYNIPVITMPTEFLHGSFTLGLYKKMGLDDCECIVSSDTDYAHYASQMGINEKLRHKMNRNIEMNKHKIFQEQESVDEWNEILSDLYEKHKII